MVDDGVPVVLAGVSEWSSRRSGPVAVSPERLAGLVDAALDRADRVLFTVTPREELDEVARWQQLADQAWCGQLRHVVASTARLSGSDRDFAGDELALALGLSPMTGRALVWECGAIAALPGLVEAVEAGRLSVRHVKALIRVLDGVSLSLEQRQAVALIALARYGGQTPGEWAELVGRLVLTIDPQAAARRRSEQTEQRKVRFYPQAGEQGAMWLQAPVERVAAAEARLRAEAARLKAAGDGRSMDQLVCDVALALLTDGTLAGQSAAPFDVHVLTPLSVLDGSADSTDPDGLGEIPGWGPVSAETARELAGQAGGFTQLTVGADGRVVGVGDRVRADRLAPAPGGPSDEQATDVAAAETSAAGELVSDELVGGDLVSDELVGGVPAAGVPAAGVPAAGAPDPSTDRRRPVDDDFLLRAVTAMRRPPVIRDLSSSHYRPGTRLGRLVRARDRTCVFPGCRRPARDTDLDHRVPWPHGRTDSDNLQCLCRHHHRAKHAVFTVLADPDGSTVWITRGRWAFRRRPPGR